MAFSDFLQNMSSIITTAFSWLSTIFMSLYQNFVFKILLGLAVAYFLTKIIIKIIFLVQGKKPLIEENFDEIEEEDEDFWEE